jgi:hypothetical protein
MKGGLVRTEAMAKNTKFNPRAGEHRFTGRDGKCTVCQMSYKAYEDDPSKPRCTGKSVGESYAIDEDTEE